jgi:hypothetical protein
VVGVLPVGHESSQLGADQVTAATGVDR